MDSAFATLAWPSRPVALPPFGQRTRPGRCHEPEIIALCTLMINQAREVFCQRSSPASFICADWEPMVGGPVDFYAASLSYIVLQQAPQSFSTPHCSHVPLRIPRAKSVWPLRKTCPLLRLEPIGTNWAATGPASRMRTSSGLSTTALDANDATRC